MNIQPTRGTRDLLGGDILRFREIETAFAQLASTYDFREIDTPIFEPQATFSRTLGEGSDIVNKEMYGFEDRGGEKLTLRPEGTASVARAVISNGLTRETPIKLFYRGPMFRYERPQKGRYRQFYQFGVELIGVPKPIADVEVLALANQMFKNLNLADKVQLEINTIGDDESRNIYRNKLVNYFSRYKSDLSSESLIRLDKNPLRILDSKDQGDKVLIEGAPHFEDALNLDSKNFFDFVIQSLDDLAIPYNINRRLVRGLDYYNHTVFEFTTEHLGAQNAVLSGGRYDNLIENMGGPELPGVGWAGGTDRLALLLGKPDTKKQGLAVIALTADSEGAALNLLQDLRNRNWSSQIIYTGNLSKKVKKADKRNCYGVLLIGPDEIDKKLVQFKDLASGEQTTLSREDLWSHLAKLNTGESQ